MFFSVPCSELCQGSVRAGRGCSGEQPCCSALPAAQMQSLQRAAVCPSPLQRAQPSLGGAPAFCFGHWLSCSFTERSGRVTVWASGRGLSRAGLGREKRFCLQPSPPSWPCFTSPVLVAKWCFLRRLREPRGAGQCCGAFLPSWGVHLNTEFSQSEGSCCAVSTAVLWLWYSVKKWV